MLFAFAIGDLVKASRMNHPFGRSGHFLLVNNVNNERKIIRNPYSETLDDAGIQTSQLLIENNVDIIMVNQIGNNAMRVLNSAGIKVYRFEGSEIDTALKLFEAGKLMEASPEGVAASVDD